MMTTKNVNDYTQRDIVAWLVAMDNRLEGYSNLLHEIIDRLPNSYEVEKHLYGINDTYLKDMKEVSD